MRKHMKRVHHASYDDIQKFNATLAATRAQINGTVIVQCDFCGKLFTTKHSLTNHINLNHKNETAPNGENNTAKVCYKKKS
uniref:C2H2-type domain-containing protein n=1 Tax=Caenorhabditis japonica TaxID=281687 RepID=A0A8R1DN76_CAEJA